jgi:phosphoglycerol transferase
VAASQDRVQRRASAGWLAAATALSTGIAVAVLRAWRFPLGLPYAYTGDAYLNAMAIKGTLDHGWVLRNPGVGAPFGQELHDFPFWDNLSMATMKVLGWGFGDWATVVNVFFLMTFPAVAIAGWLGFRRIGMSRPTATLLAVLYSLAPYHFIRGEYHLFLASYAAIPMACALVVDVLTGRRLHLGFTVATVVLVGCSVQYYPVFAAMLLAVAALVRFGATLRWRDLARGAAASAAIVAVFLLNLAPNVWYRVQHGTNPTVGQRGLHETMAFGLRMVDLLLPISQHRVGALGDKVDAATPLLGGPMEAGSPALGLVASAGFVLLLGVALVALVRRRAASADADVDGAAPDLRHFAVLAVAAFLIATTGGGAAVLAFVVGSPLRAWNRLSIFIAFFALAAVGWCVDFLRERVQPRALVAVGMVAVGLVGVLDQTSPAFAVTRTRTTVQQGWDSDEAFVASIERELPPGAAVLQLPYLSFPENGPFRGMLDYEPLRAYLHADRLRFSYGSVRDRETDWQGGLVGAPAPVAAVAAAAAGFDGIWLDRRGYPSTATEVESALATAAGSPARRSGDGAFAFVSVAELHSRFDDAPLRRAVLAPVRATFGPGFYPREIDDRHLWYWAAGPADLVLDNPLPVARTMVLRANVDALRPGPLTLTAGAETVRVPSGTEAVALRVQVPPGRSVVQVTSDAPGGPSPDGRTVAFRLTDVSLLDAVLYDAAAGLGIGVSPAAPVV